MVFNFSVKWYFDGSKTQNETTFENSQKNESEIKTNSVSAYKVKRSGLKWIKQRMTTIKNYTWIK